ncbi:hypothetical protein RSK20926_01187 [Roseobacter sp. SK209-2-6]|uniref:glycosyltransferase family 2 protein n=1 Tax=Roseobacter sp. SK209-2-6 TaxID=388739 RepID=UPI0000F3F1B2|nr:glycosyltransferase [Roseobacter sp. SK209-2-6]EBA14566.1 hypothetical protein RSK20926_01187 [Roseobacter sp. SK209-2-6]
MSDPTRVQSHAVIIPHFNDVTRLERCLEALVPQHSDGIELVVADNGSDADLEPLQARFTQVRFVQEPAKGAAMARNCGVAATSAPGLIFLDADCVPDPDWLAQACATDTKDAVVGGRVTVFDETPAPRSGAEVFETVFAFKQRDYIERKGFSVTANLVTTRAVFEATGPFVTGRSEDVDWCQRAVKKGYALRYNDAMTVAHPTRQDWPALRRKWLRLTQEMYGLTSPGIMARLAWALRAAAMPLSALAHAPRILSFPGLSHADRLRGLATLLRLRCTRAVWMLRQVMGGEI